MNSDSLTKPGQKLTKKQKKGLAFRTGGGKKRRSGGDGSDGVLDVPEADNLMLDEEDEALDNKGQQRSGPLPRQKNELQETLKSDKAKGKEKQRQGGDVRAVKTKSKKRKREDGDEDDGIDETLRNATATDEKNESSKKRKRSKLSPENASDEANKGEDGKKPSGKQRFILFVGNLKYTTSTEDIRKHFAVCDPPPSIRLLTQKSILGKSTAKSKGCAFLEFTHRNALQQALKLHQSELDGRRINVELTAGGGGKSDSRLEKLRKRNKDLHGQRTKRKTRGNGADEAVDDNQQQRPQRYSATSGMEQEHAGKRTWSVGDVDDGKTHRGGQRHTSSKVRGKKKSARPQGTGANAIQVG